MSGLRSSTTENRFGLRVRDSTFTVLLISFYYFDVVIIINLLLLLYYYIDVPIRMLELNQRRRKTFVHLLLIDSLVAL